MCLAANICAQIKNKVSPISPYLKFPQINNSKFPFFYNNDEIEMIENSNLKTYIEDIKKLFTKEFVAFKDQVRFTVNDYARCRYFVSSRNFNIIKNGKIVPALAPILDILTCDTQGVNANYHYDEKSSELFVYATEDIQVGKKVLFIIKIDCYSF